MSIYKKLAQARVKLQETGLSKSGNNRNFKYFELKDFLPEVNKIFSELNICSVVSYNHDFATMTIYDGESEDKIVFTSPMVQRALPNGTDIQNLGAIQTYQRRYLYLTALEIAENDLVDALDTSNEKPNTKQQLPKSSNNSTLQASNSTKVKESATDKFIRMTGEKNTIEDLNELWAKAEQHIKTNEHQTYIDAAQAYDMRLNELSNL